MYQDTAPGVGSVGWAQPTEGSVAPSDGLISAVQRIDALTNHGHQINAAVSDHADRILGGRPEVDEKPAPSPVRSGALGALHDHIDRLETMLQRIDQQSRRFNSI